MNLEAWNALLRQISGHANRKQSSQLTALLQKSAGHYEDIFPMKKSMKATRQPLRRNVVNVSPSFMDSHGLMNNQVGFFLFPDSLHFDQCTICANENITDEEELRVPIDLRETEGEEVYLIQPQMHIYDNVLVQRASLVREDPVTISQTDYDLFAKDKAENIEFRHLATGATMTRPFSGIKGDPALKPGQIRLTYYQREILNILEKQRAAYSQTYVATLRDKVLRTQTDAAPYIAEAEDGSFSTTASYNQLQLVPLFEPTPAYQPLSQKLGDLLVGSYQMHLTAVRPYKIDDARDVVRLSEDTMTLLGIEDTDHVILQYRDHVCKVSAMQIDSYDLMKETNILDEETDLDIIIGIPAPIRQEMEIGDVETEVTVKRDTVFLFMKNLNIQLLSILGLLLAVFEIGDGAYLTKGIICLVLLPFIIYATLSQERAKVKKYRWKKRTKKKR